MRPEELMLGDFVKFTDNDGSVYACKVAGIYSRNELFLTGDDGLELDLFDDYLNGIEPIEITEKFLLKNGFAKGQDVSGLFDEYVNDVYALRTDKDKFGMSRTIVRVVPFFDLGFIVRAERTCDDPKLGRHEFYVHRPNTQYIHQLQHVCRLCGIEIDWKL